MLSERPIDSRTFQEPRTEPDPSYGSDETSAPKETHPGEREGAETTAVPRSRSLSPDFLAQMTATLMAIAAIVASRVLLFVALAGSFVLTYLAISQPTQSLTSLVATVSFDVLVVIPLALLAWQKG